METTETDLDQANILKSLQRKNAIQGRNNVGIMRHSATGDLRRGGIFDVRYSHYTGARYGDH